MKMKAWDVWLNGRCIDTVFFDEDISADEVYRSLVNHDGYNPGIEVRRAR